MSWTQIVNAAAVTFGLVAERVGQFVLDSAEWFSVLVVNFGLTMDAIKASWEFAWRFLLDFSRNMIQLMKDEIVSYAETVVNAFATLPERIRRAMKGETTFEIMNALLLDSVIEVSNKHNANIAKSLVTSAETRAAEKRAAETFEKLKAAKKDLENARDFGGDEKDDDGKGDDGKKDKGKGDKKLEVPFGFIGLAELSREFQTLALKEGEDTDSKKLVGLGEEQKDIQEDILKANKAILKQGKDAPVIKVAD